MFYRIFYTSWPQLLEPGRGGFGVVARHKQIPVLVAHAAEASSQFAHLRGAAMHRVVYAYRTETTQSGRWHILSRIEDSGSDYSGRTNYLAQHLVADESTAHHLAEQGISPARVMMAETAWPGFDKTVGFIEVPAWSPSRLHPSGGYWSQVFDHEENRRYSLAIGPGNAAFAYPADWVSGEWASFLLGLLDEAACCTEPGCRPMCGWGTTFTTYLEPTDKPQDFTWIALPENSSLLSGLRNAGNRPVYNQQSSLPPKPAHPQVPTATTNRKAPESAERQPPGRVVVSSQDRTSPLPPYGQPRPPTPQPIGGGVSEQSGPPFPSWIIPAALVVMLVLAVVGYVAWQAVFATPDIQFKPETLSYVFDGKPKSAELSSSSEGATVSYLYEHGAGWSSSEPSNAGSYRLRVELPPLLSGWWKRSPVELTNVLRIEKAEVKIDMPNDQEFPYTKGQERPIVPIVDPEVASAQVKVSYASTIAPDRWTNDPYGNPGRYLVKAEIDSTSRNYKPVTKQANYQIKEPEPERKALDPLPVGQSKGTESSTSPQGISPAPAESKNFEKGIWLADEKAMMDVLTNMPAEGNLYVYITKTNGASDWSEIDRNHGTVKGAGFGSLFEMDKANKKPTKKTVRTSGPLVYMVGPSTNDPVFVGIEFQTSKFSVSDKAADDPSSNLRGKLELFFKQARLENINGKPCVRFFLKDDSGFVGLEKFKTKSLGTTFVFEYNRDPVGYTEKEPLKLDLTESGELDPRKMAEMSATIEATQKPVEPSGAQSANRDYFTRVKEAFLAPLAKRAENTNASNTNPIAQRLYQEINTVPATPAGSGQTNTNQAPIQAVLRIVGQSLRCLEQDAEARAWIAITGENERAKKSRMPEEPTAGADYEKKLPDHLLGADALLTRMESKCGTVADVTKSAREWVGGREGDWREHDGKAKSEAKKQSKIVKDVLRDFRSGLSSIDALPRETPAIAPTDPGATERGRKAAEAKLSFLRKLQAGGPFDNERGRLLFRVRVDGADREYVLEPNLLLKPASK